MERLLEKLKDGHARTTVALAGELDTTPADIRRKLEYLERNGIVRKVSLNLNCGSCADGKGGGCSGYGSKGVKCSSCLPSSDLMNMGEIWEVVKN